MYRYKEVIDVNPLSKTYNQKKWVRDPDNDYICQELMNRIRLDKTDVTFDCYMTTSLPDSISNTFDIMTYEESLIGIIKVLSNHKNLTVVSKPEWIKNVDIVNEQEGTFIKIINDYSNEITHGS